MKRYLKALCLLCSLCLVLSVCSACGKETASTLRPYVIGAPSSLETNATVAENDSFKLGWDADTANITVTDKKSGKVYSQVPYDYYTANYEDFKIVKNNYMPDTPVPEVPIDDKTIQMFSPIYINMLTVSSNATSTLYANPQVTRCGRIGSKEIENGIRVTYYYDAQKIAVPVDYTIGENGFSVQVVPTDIIESDAEYRVLSVGVSPMFCSAKNNKDSYIVVPSGSGAIMYTDLRNGGATRSFSAEVYGRDPAVELYEKLGNDEEIRMPIFGIVDGDRALCAIIESGSEKCTVNAQAGDPVSGYSSAYVSFRVRGYNEPVSIILAGRIRLRTHIHEAITSSVPMKVTYNVLSGADANYTGIAKCYRDYLVKNHGMSEETESKLLYTQLIGGFQSDELMLGIPYKKTRALTTYKQAEKIIKELSELSGGSLSATMTGFGTTGIATGKVGGGFKLTGVYGRSGDLSSFIKTAEDAGADLFFNFDIVRFRESAKGLGNTAVTANNAAIKDYEYNLSTKLRVMDDYNFLLQRSQLDEAAKAVAKTAKKYGIDGIALDTLGSIAYSDYFEEKYFNKENSIEQTTEILSSLKKDGNRIVLNEANAYAAALADTVLDAPTKSTLHNSFDKDIPLYQIVFKGYVDFANTAINTALNDRTEYLKAIECGSGLSFNLTADYSVDTTISGDGIFYATKYDDNKDSIKSLLEASKGYLSAVSSAKITSHDSVAENMVKTVFSNGVSVYVNFAEYKQTSQDGVTVPEESFIAFTKEGTVIE